MLLYLVLLSPVGLDSVYYRQCRRAPPRLQVTGLLFQLQVVRRCVGCIIIGSRTKGISYEDERNDTYNRKQYIKTVTCGSLDRGRHLGYHKIRDPK